ncbi:translin [Umbelopsis sp. PMI_123]|nr:translin [Umbelopsis sp. PMI_123]
MDTLEHQVFEQIQQRLEEESARKDEIRQIVRDLDRTARIQIAILNRVHADPTGPVPTVDFESIKEQLQTLDKLVPDTQYYKYCDIWRGTLQQVLFLVAFSTYLKYERVPTIAEFQDALELNVDIQNELLGLHIPYEDVLQSFISVANELSRLAVNSVTSGDYDRPRRISSFVKELMAGFQLLNLKNDNLRKRFDSLKYDLKRIEEVVYDVSLRGLTRK